MLSTPAQQIQPSGSISPVCSACRATRLCSGKSMMKAIAAGVWKVTPKTRGLRLLRWIRMILRARSVLPGRVHLGTAQPASPVEQGRRSTLAFLIVSVTIPGKSWWRTMQRGTFLLRRRVLLVPLGLPQTAILVSNVLMPAKHMFQEVVCATALHTRDPVIHAS